MSDDDMVRRGDVMMVISKERQWASGCNPVLVVDRCIAAVRDMPAIAAYAAMKEGTSTLSPIAAAARVLLADPDTFDGFKGYILNRHDMDTTMSDYAEGAMDYLRAIAEQEKAE